MYFRNQVGKISVRSITIIELFLKLIVAGGWCVLWAFNYF